MNRLELKTDIYSIENIIKTCEAYKELAEISICKTADAVILQFAKCRYEENLTMKEFENYLINIENV